MAGRTGKPVTRVPAFWDASALVPLCVRQGITPGRLPCIRPMTPSSGGRRRLRLRARLARLVRMKQLDSRDWAKVP